MSEQELATVPMETMETRTRSKLDDRLPTPERQAELRVTYRANLNRIIGNEAIDPMSSSIPHRTYLCQVRRAD